LSCLPVRKKTKGPRDEPRAELERASDEIDAKKKGGDQLRSSHSRHSGWGYKTTIRKPTKKTVLTKKGSRGRFYIEKVSDGEKKGGRAAQPDGWN